jgi:hypothetical protein
MIKVHFIGRGMHLEFHHPQFNTPIITSPIREIEELPRWEESAMAALARSPGEQGR